MVSPLVVAPRVGKRLRLHMVDLSRQGKLDRLYVKVDEAINTLVRHLGIAS
ncbi:MAG TPA: hypothetical protein VG013_07465 [Gemmataceae bacterium]|nr:hypothetical protein [Gemmataceae bacterium]